MRNAKIVWIFLFLFFGCNERKHNSEIFDSEEGNSETICSNEYCVDEISEFDNGFFLSPIDVNFKAEDSDGNIASTNTLLVKFSDNANQNEIEDVLDEINGKISAFIPEVNIYEIKFNADSLSLVERNIRTLSASGIVELAEKNYAVKLENLDIENVSEDGLWGFEQIKLAKAYDFIREENITLHPVKIAILDNGFDLNHREFSGLDVEAFDLADIDEDVMVTSKDGHGTATAGIIFAQDDGYGINGIAFNADFIALKVFSDSGFDNETFLRTVIAGIIHVVKKGASVINTSFKVETDSENIGFLEIAVHYAYSHNVVMTASSGNNGLDATNHYPSAFSEVISVGSVNQNDERSNFSGYSQNDNPDILTLAAPGEDILLLGLKDGYGNGIGTSFAAPMVAGLAGLLLQIKPDASPDRIRQVMYNSGVEIYAQYPDGTFHIWRRINALEAVKMITSDMDLPKQYIGKSCTENSDCDFDLACLSGVCTEFCFEESDRGQNLGWSCSNCNLFCECPLGSICKSFPQNYDRIPARICLLN